MARGSDSMELDAVIVGAGFAGLYALHKLRGLGLRARVLEAGGGGAGTIEAETEAESGWAAHVNAVADATLFRGCNSWYLGANVPGKPRVFMPYFGFPQYVEKCNEMAVAGYRGFTLSL